ncbi:MAG: helix-turn-helix domain-containing protein [Vagococcus salmoninarum]|uniref:helix-turn-helix domain-containing protein n=1 Tax=Vagococcus salmoninarum TaxID=2739 RepID=UPI003F971270
MIELNLTELGNRIKNIRLSLGLSMEEFGTKLSTSKGAVNNWEKGKNSPNSNRLKKIAELANISLIELTYGSYQEYIIFLINEALEYRSEFIDNNEKIFKENESINQQYNRISSFYYSVIYRSDDYPDDILEKYDNDNNSPEVRNMIDSVNNIRRERIMYLVDEVIKLCEETNIDFNNKKQILEAIEDTIARLMMKEDYTNEGFINFAKNQVENIFSNEMLNFIYPKNKEEVRSTIDTTLIDEVYDILHETTEKIKKLRTQYVKK